MDKNKPQKTRKVMDNRDNRGCLSNLKKLRLITISNKLCKSNLNILLYCERHKLSHCISPKFQAPSIKPKRTATLYFLGIWYLEFRTWNLDIGAYNKNVTNYHTHSILNRFRIFVLVKEINLFTLALKLLKTNWKKKNFLRVFTKIKLYFWPDIQVLLDLGWL